MNDVIRLGNQIQTNKRLTDQLIGSTKGKEGNGRKGEYSDEGKGVRVGVLAGEG